MQSKSKTPEKKTIAKDTEKSPLTEPNTSNLSIDLTKTTQKADEHRKKLYQQFEKAQEEYLARRKAQGVKEPKKLDQKILGQADMSTLNPDVPDFNQLRLLTKLGQKMHKVMQRSWRLDDDNFYQYKTPKDAKPSKQYSLIGAKAIIEEYKKDSKDQTGYNQWKEIKPLIQFRLKIEFIRSDQVHKTVFIYSPDTLLLKTIQLRIRIGSNPKSKANAMKQMIKILKVKYEIGAFEWFWFQFLTLNEKRTNRLVAFQLLASNLIDVQGLDWQRNRLIFNQVLKHAKVQVPPLQGVIVSSFKKGAKISIEETSDQVLSSKPLKQKVQGLSQYVLPAHEINNRADLLAILVRSRRLVRSQEAQKELDYLYQKSYHGFESNKISLQNFRRKDDGSYAVEPQTEILGRNARLLLKEDSIQVENLNPSQLKQAQTLLLPLADVSIMTTDLIDDKRRTRKMDEQKDYTIEIYGPLNIQELKYHGTSNPAPTELCYAAPLQHHRTKYFRIEIKSITLPYEFVKQFNHKIFIRVRLNQMKSPDSTEQTTFYVMSNLIHLAVPDLKLKNQSQIQIETNLTFHVDRLINLPADKQKERFTFSLIYMYSRLPVPAVLKEYILSKEQQSFHQELAECFDYVDTPAPQSVILKNQSYKNLAGLTFNIIKNVNSTVKAQELDLIEGPRLLVGRYCILDADSSAIECQVMRYNRDRTVLLRKVANHEEFQNPIPMSRLKFIERQGVSVYPLSEIPLEYKENKFLFSWKLTINTSDKSLVNMIQFAIQKKHVAIASQRRIAKQQTNIARGDIMCSLLHVHALGHSEQFQFQEQNLQPRIQVTIFNPKQSDKTQYSNQILKTDIKNPSKSISWVNQKNPTGQILNLGNFEKSFNSEDKDDKCELRFGVMNNNVLMGSCKVSVSEIIDLKEQAKEFSLQLILNNKDAGVLTIQTRFIPDHSTRHEFNLYATQNIKTPEAYILLKTILNPMIVDRYNYSVPIGHYHWKDHQSSNYMNVWDHHHTPEILKNRSAFQQRLSSMKFAAGFVQKNQELIQQIQAMTPRGAEKLKSINIRKTWMEDKVFISQEERSDIDVWIKNPKRPVRQEYTTSVINSWIASIFIGAINAERQASSQMWSKYFSNLKRVEQKFIESDFKTTQTMEAISEVVNAMYERSKIQKLSTSQQDYPKLHNVDLGHLLFLSKWEQREKDTDHKEEFQRHVNLGYLVRKYGIPDDMRIKIWRELLKVQVIEFDEYINFKNTLPSYWNQSMTVYQNYQNYANQMDILAFRQVDQDVASYQFPNRYLESLPYPQRNAQIIKEKCSMRKVLRALVVWSRNKVFGEQECSMTYNNETLDIIQKILAVSRDSSENDRAEDVFWILVGMIRNFPKPFSVSHSLLVGESFSVMRNEMIAFKAMIEQYLPNVYHKLKEMGIPIEMIVYKPILSFYATFFSSDVVLSLWDNIFLYFGSSNKFQRKRALWYILSPAFLIFKKKETQILEARSVDDILAAFTSGEQLWYDPRVFIQDLQLIIEELFVEKLEKVEQNVFYSFIFGPQIVAKNKKATYFEEKRNNYNQFIDKLFKCVKEENSKVTELVKKQNITAEILRNTLINQFQQVTRGMVKHPSLSESREIDLNLTKIELFIHSVTQMPESSLKKYKVRIAYGTIINDEFVEGNLQLSKASAKRSPAPWLSSVSIEGYTNFQYLPRKNWIRIELVKEDGFVSCFANICLLEIEQESFANRRIVLTDPTILQLKNKFLYPFSQLQISFYLTRNPIKINKNDSIAHMLTSFTKRTPDVVDIFNKNKYEDLSDQFQILVQKENEELSMFLNEQKVLDVINDSYNYVSISNYGYVTFEDFQNFADQLLPPSMREKSKLLEIFNTFNGNFQNYSKQVQESLESAKNFNVRQTIKLKLKQTQNPDFHTTTGNETEFCLRQFLTAVVLISLSTVEEKVSILYDLFEIAEKTNESIRLQYAYQLISTIFNRCLYFMPQNELMNVCEYIFNESVSILNKAYWTLSAQNLQSKSTADQIKTITLEEFTKSNIKLSQENINIDLTQQIQHSFINYFSVFGTKTIDFNPDTSAFADLENLIGQKPSQLLQAQDISPYKLVLQLQTNGEYFLFEVVYNKLGKLQYAGACQEKPEILINNQLKNYFERHSCRLFLNGQTKPISKVEFLQKFKMIPMLSNLIRCETFYQDRTMNTFTDNYTFSRQLIVTLIVEQFQFKFEFSNLTSRLYDERIGEIPEVSELNNVFTFQMESLRATTLFAELRLRILSAFKMWVFDESKKIKPALQQLIEVEIAGAREWCYYQFEEWIQVQDFARVSSLPGGKDFILLKLRTPYNLNQEPLYDCLTLYRHGDFSYEWRPCRIVQKDAIKDEYTLEFEHLKKAGKQLWLKRASTEILLSSYHTRLHKKGFKKDCKVYMASLYGQKAQDTMKQ